MVLLVFAVGQTAEGMYLTPKLVGDRIGLHPVTVIFAVLAGGQFPAALRWAFANVLRPGGGHLMDALFRSIKISPGGARPGFFKP